MSDGPDSATVVDLLADDCARRILVETKQEARSAAELSDRLDTSEPTIYRRLEKLTEYDLVTEEIQPVTDGKNYRVYRAQLESVRLDLTDDGFDITLTARERMADRFTKFVEGR